MGKTQNRKESPVNPVDRRLGNGAVSKLLSKIKIRAYRM
jgi:hypothetical protein